MFESSTFIHFCNMLEYEEMIPVGKLRGLVSSLPGLGGKVRIVLVGK